MKIVKIVTHHKYPERAAELFLKERVVAIGFQVVGDISKKSRQEIKKILKKEWKKTEHESANAASQLIMFRDKVELGDFVFAYKGNNKVALVGEIIGDYRFNTKNKVGNLKGEISYPNQRKVKWRNNPRNFDRFFCLVSYQIGCQSLALYPFANMI